MIKKTNYYFEKYSFAYFVDCCCLLLSTLGDETSLRTKYCSIIRFSTMNCPRPSPNLIVWVIGVIIVYLVVVRNADSNVLMPENSEVNNVADAVVYISMGKMAHNNLVDFSIASVVKVGKWEKDIYVLTDLPKCFQNAKENYGVTPIYVPSLGSIIEIKALKTTLFEHLPAHVRSIIYLDIDILVAKPLRGFMRDLSTQIIARNNNLQAHHSVGSAGYVNLTHGVADVAMFPDAKGHYVGFCAGCEKWHTGVIWIRRHSSPAHHTNICMSEWKKVLLSGKFNTDQESMDATEGQGSCPHMISLLTKHLIFAKDYIAMGLLDTPTFWHVTGAGRMDEQDWFYSTFILPRLYYSLHPPLNPEIINTEKQCSSEL